MSGCKMLCFQRNWFRADLCEMARSCSKLQQVDKLCKYAENSTIKVFYWGPLRVVNVNEKFNYADENSYKVTARKNRAAMGKIFVTAAYFLMRE